MHWKLSLRGLLHCSAVRRSAVAPLLALIIALAATLPAAAGNQIWTQKGLAGSGVASVAVDPRNSNVLLAGTWGNGLYRSADRGQTWTRVGSNLFYPYVNDVKFDPWNPNIAYAAVGLYGVAGGTAYGGLWRSSDNGRTWSARIQGHVVYGIAVYARNPNVVYVTASGPQVARSTDRGLTWKWTTSGIDTSHDLRAVAVDPTNSNRVVVGGTSEGGSGIIYLTTSGGSWWTRSWSPSSAVTRPTSVAALAFNRYGTVVFAAATSRLLRSFNRGATWSTNVVAASGAEYASVVTSPTNSAEAFVGTSASVWRTTNNGGSFAKLDSSIGTRANGLAIDRANPRTLYAATLNTFYGATGDGLWAYTFPPSR